MIKILKVKDWLKQMREIKDLKHTLAAIKRKQYFAKIDLINYYIVTGQEIPEYLTDTFVSFPLTDNPYDDIE